MTIYKIFLIAVWHL